MGLDLPEGVYAAVADRHPDAAVIVPPRTTAVPSGAADTAPTQRDGHLRCIAEAGRMVWQTSSGYSRRAKVKAAIIIVRMRPGIAAAVSVDALMQVIPHDFGCELEGGNRARKSSRARQEPADRESVEGA